jgi:hypothetical protein
VAAISSARLMEDRADAMDCYLGDMRKDMPAQDGRPRAVSTDVADTIEGPMPSRSIMRGSPIGVEERLHRRLRV